MGAFIIKEKQRKNPLKSLLIFLIKTYQLTLSPRFSNGSCRYYPTCSHYAIEAIETHGVIKGTGLAVWRIMRCNPFSKGGYDPVPPKKEALKEEPKEAPKERKRLF